jgi:putative lipoprotein
MRTLLLIIAFVISVTGLFAGPAMAKDETLSGTVTYLNRSMLPPDAVLNVELVDVSLADAPSVRMSSRRYAIDHVPFAFELAYDPFLIDERYSYAIQAQISQNGKVLYRTTKHYPALTRNAPEQVEIVVDLMPEAAGLDLEGSKWEVSEITGRLLVVEKRPSIRFLPDGRVAIDTGCNKFNGPITISGSSIRFSDKMAGTMMACVPPYDKLEQDVLSVLPQVTGAVQSGDQLSLTNGAGVTLLRMSQCN